MFDRFGEFDSAEEINAKAAELKAAGDMDGLTALAEENGLDEEDAQDYMDNGITTLCTWTTAAFGKLDVECKELKLEREFEMLFQELKMMCYKESVARGIRKKGKDLATYLAKVIDLGYKQAVTPPKAILDKVTEVPKQYRNQVKTGMPSKADRKALILEYYGEKVSE